MKIIQNLFLIVILGAIYIKTQEEVKDDETVEEEIVVDEDDEVVEQAQTVVVQNENKETIVKPIVEEKPKPKLNLVDPIRRIGTSNSKIDVAPCGGIEKTAAGTLTNMGSRINAIWEITTPIPSGTCRVSMSTALDANFTTLIPISKHAKYDESFQFECGRQPGFEFMEFALPENYACDSCTLQLSWKTNEGTFYSCSDLMIIGDKMSNCMAKCLNGGACVNGSCVCKKNFDGEFCGNNLTQSSNWGWIVLIIVLLAALGVGGYLLFIKNQEHYPWMIKNKEKPAEENFIK